MRLIAILVSALLLTASCQQDVTPRGDATARQVQAIVSSKNVRTVDVYVGEQPVAFLAPFRIEGQFLILLDGLTPTRYFNLSQVKRFELRRAANPDREFIAFYF